MKLFIPPHQFIFLLLLPLILVSCLKDEGLNDSYNGFAPEDTGDGWVISYPEQEQMDADRIGDLYRAIYDEDRYPTLRSLLIVRNGHLVAETYVKDHAERDRLHNLMSATKSITSILTGIALDKGLIASVDSPVCDYLDPYFDDDQEKRNITISHVLTMETGLEFENDRHTSQLISGTGSSLEYVLHQEMIFVPGTDYYYGDGNPQLLSGIIESVYGQSLVNFAGDHLFGPLGIDQFRWESHADGLNFGALGLWLKPRDMAKIGVLMANDGIWNNDPIVSASWIKNSTSKRSAFRDYGYYWYVLGDGAFYAEGNGGQLIWIYPSRSLVVVITSDPYTKAWNLSEGYENIFTLILNSLDN